MTSDFKGHPTKDQLLSLSLGKLTPHAAEEVAEHVNGCQECCETIVSLQDDTFVSLVSNSPAPAPVDEALKAPESQPALPDMTVDVESGVTGELAPPAELPSELRDHPRYEILDLIGRGGMGDVYQAQHKVMNRVVALKVIKPELVKNDAAVVRFRREVQAAASLRHPNIVTAFDAEQAGNLHYLVMEHVDGENLDEVVSRSGRLSVDDACDIIRQAADGLQHAYDLGMVHRDIKPHNLMIERQTRTITGSATVVKILDFGLANLANEVAEEALESEEQQTAVDEDDPQDVSPGVSLVYQLTQMGTMMGTPDYIAPEQAKDAHTADIRADIYSLGCTFYTLLTGKAPFSEGSVMEKVKAHTHEDAPPLSEFRDDVPPEVEAVLLKMMAKDPAERYQTPADVAEALSAVGGASKPVKDTAGDGLGKPSYRRQLPPLLTGIATLFLALIAAATIFYIQTNNGVVRVTVTDPSLKVSIAGQTITMDDGKKPLTVRAGEQKLIVRQKDSDFHLVTDSFQLRRGDRIVLKVDLLPGEVVVSKDGERFEAKSLPLDHTVVVSFSIRNAEMIVEIAGEPVVERGIRDRVKALIALDPEVLLRLELGDGIDARSGDHATGLGTLLKEIEKAGGRFVVPPSTADRFAKLRDLAEQVAARSDLLKRVGFAMNAHHDRRGQLPPAKSAAGFDAEDRPRLSWRVHLLPYLNHDELFQKFRLDEPWDSEHNKTLLDQMPDVYKTSDSATETTLLAVVGEGTAYQGKQGLSLNRDFADGTSNTAMIVDVGRERAMPWTKPEDLHFDSKDPIRAFGTPDFGDVFLALMVDTSVQSIPYDTAPESLRALFTRAGGDNFDPTAKRTTPLPSLEERITLVRRFPGHRDHLADVAVSPDGRFIVSGGWGVPVDRPVRKWDLATGREILDGMAFGQHNTGKVVISPRGTYLATRRGNDNGHAVTLWNLRTGKHVRDLNGHTDYVNAIVFSPDESHVFTGGKDKTVCMWNRQSGERLQSTNTQVPVHALALSANGTRLYFPTISEDRTATNLVEWNVEEWRETRRFEPVTPAAIALAISPDGRTICGGLYNRNTMALWDLASGKLRAEQAAHETPVTHVAYTGDGRHIVTTARDKTLKIWDATTLRLAFAHEAQTHCTNYMALTPDGRHVVTCGGDYFEGGKRVDDGDFDLRVWQLPESVWPQKQSAMRAEQLPDWLGEDLPFGARSFFTLPDDNAAPLYVKAFEEFSPGMFDRLSNLTPEQQKRRDGLIERGKRFDEVYAAFAKDPTSVDAARADAVLREYQAGFKLLRKAQQMPDCVFPIELKGLQTFVTADLPRAAMDVGRVTELQVFRAVQSKDRTAAAEHLESLLRLARDLRPRGNELYQTTAYGLEQTALEKLVPLILTADELTAEDCDRLLAIIAAHQDADDIDPVLAAEQFDHLFWRQLMHELESGEFAPKEVDREFEIDAKPFPTSGGVLIPILLDFHDFRLNSSAFRGLIDTYRDEIPKGMLEKLTADPDDAKKLERVVAALALTMGLDRMTELDYAIERRTLNRRYEQLREVRQRPYPKRFSDLDQLDKHWTTNFPQETPKFLGLFQQQWLSDLANTSRKSDMIRGVAPSFVAVRRWELVHGKPATTLDEALEDVKLPVPFDPFTGQPMKLRTGDGTGLIVPGLKQQETE